MLVAERGLNLVGRRGHDEPQTHADDRHEDDVVEDDADAAGDAEAGQPVDTGPERGGEDDRGEQERHHQAGLPDHDGRREDARDDEGRDRDTPGEPGQVVFPPVSFLSLGLRLSPRRLAHRHVAVVPAADRFDTLCSL
jgi:hypothetical protein